MRTAFVAYPTKDIGIGILELLKLLYICIAATAPTNMEVNNTINKSKRIEFSQQLKLMNDAIGIKNKSIFVLPSRLRVEAIDPLETKSLQPINNIIFSGWLTGHPDKSHAITDFNSLLQNSYFMIDHNDTSVVSDIQDIVKTHYNKKFNTKIVLNNNDCRIIEFELIE